MSRPQGLPKTGGRQAGTPNRKTKSLEELFDSHSFDVPTQLMELLPILDPGRKADILLSLMKFIYPQRKAVDHKIMDQKFSCPRCSEIKKMTLEEMKTELKKLADIDPL